MITKRYEFVGGNSKKFWQYKYDEKETQAEVSWGRIGTAGTFQTTTVDDAKKRADEKVRKGYSMVFRDFKTPTRHSSVAEESGEIVMTTTFFADENEDVCENDLWEEIILNIKKIDEQK